MNQTVFAQFMELIPRHEFNKCVRRYRGNYRTRHFSCWDQFLSMSFAQ
ncbi:MAG: IS4 family transposase, partial [Candidatus Marinimicrobia bacterium CG_4_10_14_0_2_um_filter_48_9]